MIMRLPLFLLVLLLAGPGRAEVSEFTSYDECILESLKGVSSDVAANAIIASCRSKFPETAPVAVPAAEPEAAQAPEAAAEPQRVEQAEAAAEPKPPAAPARAGRSRRTSCAS